jgi:hypothetical protein
LATGRHNEGIFDLVRLRASDQKGDEVLQILFASGVQQCGRHRHQSELVRERLLRLDDCFKQVAFAETIADGSEVRAKAASVAANPMALDAAEASEQLFAAI